MTDVPLRDPSRLYVKFPTTLARPVFAPIDCDSLAAINSDLAKVDIGYLREKLQAKGASMLAGLEKTKPVPADGLPKELDVVINDLSAEVPTHMLAVWSKEPHPAGQRRPVGLFPVHDVMLAANCAHLPAFPASIPPPPLTEGDTIRVPVVPLCVPHRASFGILQNYIYTRKAELVLAHLIPKPPTGVPRMQVTQVVGESLTPAALATYLMRIHGFWSNVCALGVFDDALWRVIDFAWGFVMDALKHAGNSGVRVEGTSQASAQQ
ncbi:hypothetical protein EXIGLDRAFT_712565 [Exidia glandulosa HHB12029]|uniref:Clp1-like protein n=1 Tax=Exidia glandulosa HHB12029 TaxID=1314781 RepID=A0A165MAS7_EXIGL|nr:hypothetical protein EXIGLDRAFT_712565 [Exidia glandulosa HHB12029]